MENKCPKCGEDIEYTFENEVEQDGDTLLVNYWCRCKSCGEHWRYVEMFRFCSAWIVENNEEN